MSPTLSPSTPPLAQRQFPSEKTKDAVTVLATGFGPFLEKVPINSSWLIASSLPALIPATTKNPTPIHIYVHHEAVRVAYRHVVSLVPSLLPPGDAVHPKPDIVLHIGLAAANPYYTLEEGAHGRGYGAIADVDGETFADELADEKFPRSRFPPVLRTSFRCDDVMARWRANLGYSSEDNPVHDFALPDVRPSPDAGSFLCGFLYYNSLAHFHSIRQEERPVVFLHVPDISGDEEMISTGRDITVALIKALVESMGELGAENSEVEGRLT